MAKKEPKDTWKLVGFVGVDTGQVVICDPCYLPTQERPSLKEAYPDVERTPEWSSDPSEELHDPKFVGEFSYRGACSTTMYFRAGQLYFRKGHRGAGVVSDTMVGDGTYPVYAHTSPKGEIRGLMIRFDGAEPDLKRDGEDASIPVQRTELVAQADAIEAKRQQAQEKQFDKEWAEVKANAEALLGKAKEDRESPPKAAR